MTSAAILTLAGLWALSAVMTPVAFALFIIALIWPLRRRLEAVLPQVIAVLVTAAVALLAIGDGSRLVAWGFGGIAQWVIANAARLQGLYIWGTLWGIAGAFIGVPILIALATVSARHPAVRPIAVLLSAGGAARVDTDQ